MNSYCLPGELSIRTAADVHRGLQAWVAGLQDAPLWTVDASRVEEADAAGVQLLLSLARSAGLAQAALRIDMPSAVLQHACRTLGVAATLRLGADERSPA